MSRSTRKYCAQFPCSNYAEPGSAYCAEHRPARALKETDPFYLSPAWRKFRNYYVSIHPFCELCEREGRLVPVDVVDHVVELKDGGAPLSESNAMSLCNKCHGLKTAKEKARRKNHQ